MVGYPSNSLASCLLSSILELSTIGVPNKIQNSAPFVAGRRRSLAVWLITASYALN